jgi:hypothetical protein
MDWKYPYMSTQDIVWRNWLRLVHGERYAAEYESNDDPAFKHHSDRDHYPRKYTRND